MVSKAEKNHSLHIQCFRLETSKEKFITINSKFDEMILCTLLKIWTHLKQNLYKNYANRQFSSIIRGSRYQVLLLTVFSYV